MRRVVGHNQPMQYLDIDTKTGNIYTGCMGGRVVVWRPNNEERTLFTPQVISGEVATKKIAGLAVAGGEVASIAWDDKLRIGDSTTGEFKSAIPLGAQPKGVAVSPAAPDVRIVVTGSAVIVFKGASQVSSTPAAWGPTCVDVSLDGSKVAVGGKDKKVHVYTLSGTELKEAGETKEAGAEISVVAISPDGSQIAAGDALREVRLYASATQEALVSSRWMNHTTRVTGLKWSPNGSVIASVSTDRRLCIWDPKSDTAKHSFDLAHPQPFAACAWASDTELWTLGTDGVATRRIIPA